MTTTTETPKTNYQMQCDHPETVVDVKLATNPGKIFQDLGNKFRWQLKRCSCAVLVQ